MNEKRYDTDAVKERLKQYIDNDRDIDNDIERLERLETRMIGLGAQQLSDMPRSPSHSNDRITDLLNRKVELEEQIRLAVQAQTEERKTIEAILKAVCDSEQKAVVRMHYFDGYKWPAVNEMLFGNKTDYVDKEASYLRRTHRIHCAALVRIAAHLENQKTDDTLQQPQGA